MTIAIALLLLSFTKKSFSSEEDWVFQALSSSGNIISNSLLVLKKNNSFFIEPCSFFEVVGLRVTTSDLGNCIAKSLDKVSTYTIKKDHFYVNGKKIGKALNHFDSPYISTEVLEPLGFSFYFNTQDVTLVVSHKNGLPIDKKKELLSQAVRSNEKRLIKNNKRESFNLNKAKLEISKSNIEDSWSGELYFDLYGGELKYFNCDRGCESYVNWSNELKVGNYYSNFSLGDNVNYYFPREYDFLNNSVQISLSKKNKKQEIYFPLRESSEYFIYRDNVLVRRGFGNLESILLDIDNEKYFSDYKIKFVDERGRVDELDVLGWQNLLKKNDFDFKTLFNGSDYRFNSFKYGVVNSLNVKYANLSNKGRETNVYGALYSNSFVNVEVGEMEAASENINFEQFRIKLKPFSYSYNHRYSIEKVAIDEQNNILTFSNRFFFLQAQYKIEDRRSLEREYLLGKQFYSYFLSVQHFVGADNSTFEQIDVASEFERFSYSLGYKNPHDITEVFSQISYDAEPFLYSANIVSSKNSFSVNLRLDFNSMNWKYYINLKNSSENISEFVVGLSTVIFPAKQNRKLSSQPEQLLVLKVFLDENRNGARDKGERLLEKIGGYVNNRRNYALSSKQGELLFELKSSSRYAYFDFDESTFSSLFFGVEKQRLKYEIIPRKTNIYEVAIPLNGIILIDCSGNKMSNIILKHKSTILFRQSSCKDHVIIENLSAGEYELYSNNSVEPVKKISLTNQNEYYQELNF